MVNARITAAANGIGRETALASACEGAQVLATDVRAPSLAELKAEEPRLDTAILDATNAAAIGALFAERSFEVVFNCAGLEAQASAAQIGRRIGRLIVSSRQIESGGRREVVAATKSRSNLQNHDDQERLQSIKMS